RKWSDFRFCRMIKAFAHGLGQLVRVPGFDIRPLSLTVLSGEHKQNLVASRLSSGSSDEIRLTRVAF
ncbi:MAG: hypothetical protein JJ992_15820, partial [Planctomycetes bacterium]|nr:hypothetical protein [Planctomycetota bacterium]